MSMGFCCVIVSFRRDIRASPGIPPLQNGASEAERGGGPLLTPSKRNSFRTPACPAGAPRKKDLCPLPGCRLSMSPGRASVPR